MLGSRLHDDVANAPHAIAIGVEDGEICEAGDEGFGDAHSHMLVGCGFGQPRRPPRAACAFREHALAVRRPNETTQRAEWEDDGMSSPSSRSSTRFPTIPNGETVGSYETYERAQGAVDQLARADFPLGDVSIVGSNLKSVERVTGKMNAGRAALRGLLSGVMLGVFVGLLVLILTPQAGFATLIPVMLVAVGFSVLWSLIGFMINPSKKEFTSVMQILAAHFDVVVTPELAGRARNALGTSAHTAAPVAVPAGASTAPNGHQGQRGAPGQSGNFGAGSASGSGAYGGAGQGAGAGSGANGSGPGSGGPTGQYGQPWQAGPFGQYGQPGQQEVQSGQPGQQGQHGQAGQQPGQQGQGGQPGQPGAGGYDVPRTDAPNAGAAPSAEAGQATGASGQAPTAPAQPPRTYGEAQDALRRERERERRDRRGTAD